MKVARKATNKPVIYSSKTESVVCFYSKIPFITVSTHFYFSPSTLKFFFIAIQIFTLMLLEESLEQYSKLKVDYTFDEIEELFGICKKLGMHQKIIGATFYNFYRGRSCLQLEPDEIVHYSSIIDLAFKMMETSKTLESIIQKCADAFYITIDVETMATYLEIVELSQNMYLFTTFCDLEAPKAHDIIHDLCISNKIPADYLDIAMIYLNDMTIMLPCALYFTQEECAFAALYLLSLYDPKSFFEIDVIPLDPEQSFQIRFNISADVLKVVLFIAEEVIQLYEMGHKHIDE